MRASMSAKGPDQTAAVAALLREIAGTGEFATIVYNGGTHHGEPRVIAPLSISGRLHFVAVEQGSTARKTYRIDRVASVVLADARSVVNASATHAPVPAPRYASWAQPPDLPELSSLAQYVEHCRGELIASGWYLHEHERSIAVGGFFKNGAPKRTQCIWLRYLDAEEQGSSLARPWRLDSWRQDMGRTFPDLNTAFGVFLGEIRASDALHAKGCFTRPGR